MADTASPHDQPSCRSPRKLYLSGTAGAATRTGRLRWTGCARYVFDHGPSRKSGRARSFSGSPSWNVEFCQDATYPCND